MILSFWIVPKVLLPFFLGSLSSKYALQSNPALFSSVIHLRLPLVIIAIITAIKMELFMAIIVVIKLKKVQDNLAVINEGDKYSYYEEEELLLHKHFKVMGYYKE